MVHEHGKRNGWYAHKVQTSIEMQCDIMKRFHLMCVYTWKTFERTRMFGILGSLKTIHWDAKPAEIHGMKVKLFVKFIIAFSQLKIVSTLHRYIPFVM